MIILFSLFNLADDFESKFQFHPIEDLPPPDEFKPFPRTYPSKELRGWCVFTGTGKVCYVWGGGNPLQTVFARLNLFLSISCSLPMLTMTFSPSSPTPPFILTFLQWTPAHRGWGHTFDDTRLRLHILVFVYHKWKSLFLVHIQRAIRVGPRPHVSQYIITFQRTVNGYTEYYWTHIYCVYMWPVWVMSAACVFYGVCIFVYASVILGPAQYWLCDL